MMVEKRVEEEQRVQSRMERLSVQMDESPSDGSGGRTRVKKERSTASSSPGGSKDSGSRSRSPATSPDDHKPTTDSVLTAATALDDDNDNDNGNNNTDGHDDDDNNNNNNNVPLRPKLNRKSSSKMVSPPVTLFDNLPDMTDESCQIFQQIPDCLYGSKALGTTEHDTLDCDCPEEWRDGENHACGEDSDCINRATKMECVNNECNCGNSCQNQRFQRKQYANVSVIKTEKKGYGLRANAAMHANDFVFEYIGEVINEPTFRRRMMQYDKEGIKHFYFMSLTKSEFVDATKKGNLGRFCNHSCNPNCYVDKWVVGNKLRMGIFTLREIHAGEELVFNYNVDRYGADPQPCYCGEPNCIGFIGGKTQTERATKLSNATMEALGIDDGDSWDTAVAVVAKKPRKKRIAEEDEEYVSSVEPRGLDERGVKKVMAALMQCKEKWIAVKLLERIQNCEEQILPTVVRMHGYEFLKTTLKTFKEDYNVILQVLAILGRFPRLTRNKIVDSKIETVVQPLTESEHEDVATTSKHLVEEWGRLAMGYRIPRLNGRGAPSHQTAAANPYNPFDHRRGVRQEEPKSVGPLPDNVPKGPKSNIPRRNMAIASQRQRRPPDPSTLPAGWLIATDKTGHWYYYTKGGQTTWHRPTAPAPDLAAQSSANRAAKEKKSIQDIINSITKSENPSALRRSTSQTPQPPSAPTSDPKKQEKWRSLPLEKQVKMYENTLYPHIKYVVDRFKHRLPKEDLKKFAKDLNKKLAQSDYKNKRVTDPTSITRHQEKKIKQYVTEFFEKAVVKHEEMDKKKQERLKRQADTCSPVICNGASAVSTLDAPAVKECATSLAISDIDEDLALSSPGSSDRKRKRDDDALPLGSPSATPSEVPSLKRLREELDTPTPPPPPPPLPENGVDGDADMDTDALANMSRDTGHVDMMNEDVMMNGVAGAQEDDVERAQLREQEAALERENELNMLDFEREQGQWEEEQRKYRNTLRNSHFEKTRGAVDFRLLARNGDPELETKGRRSETNRDNEDRKENGTGLR